MYFEFNGKRVLIIRPSIGIGTAIVSSRVPMNRLADVDEYQSTL
jgi:hypothetical protein